MTTITVGDRLREAREEAGLTQHAIARAAGISQSTYSDLERGDNAGKSLENLAKIARTLSVSADRILGIEEPKRRRRAKTGDANLTQLETRLLGIARELRPKARRRLLQFAQDTLDEERDMRRYLELVEQIEEIDKYGIFARSQERLYVLAAEMGSMKAAVPVLKAEVEAEFVALKRAEQKV